MRLARPKRQLTGDRSRPRPPLFRSIRTRLAVTFFLVTALSVAVIYIVVAPPLTSGLRNQEAIDLQRLVIATYNTQPQIRNVYRKLANLPADQANGTATQQTHQLAAQLANQLAVATVSQVSVIDVLGSPTGFQPPSPAPLFAGSPDSGENAAIAHFAATSIGTDDLPPNATVRAIVQVGTSRLLAVVGVGFLPKRAPSLLRAVVFSVTLNDVAGAVALVHSRILLAAAIGLFVALLTGALVARALTVRVLRLERTAQRVAQGDFGAHFSDSSGDELGQLARELAHMQSQLEGLDAARRRFIATASHELRTPIFSLGGFLELIQDEALDDETRRQFVGQVRDQVDRLGKLATQLLDLTRLESGAVELAATPTDLGVLTRAVSAEFGPALAQHGSELRLRLPEAPIRVTCDGERVGQLLRILIDNALAHTPSGTDLLVAATPAENGTGARLSVTDSGPGIPPEAIARVFEPFYSADGARGAGLGLAIARELAVHMDAELEVISSPGATSFTLTLPADQT